MPIQRVSDDESEDNESVADLPTIIPKYSISEQKLKHLEKARARKAELAEQKKEERQKEKEHKLILSKGIKKIKNPASLEVIQNEILKNTNLRQPKQQQPPPPETPKPTKKKEPKIVVEESEPEVIIVKRPRKKIVVEESTTETEPEIKRKSRTKRQPIESESESEYERPPKPQKQPLKPPTAYQPREAGWASSHSDLNRAPPPRQPLGFKINF